VCEVADSAQHTSSKPQPVSAVGFQTHLQVCSNLLAAGPSLC
jgi:hypothetical protein